MSNDKPQQISSQFILYQDDNGITNVNVRFDGQDVWLSQQQIALLFDTTQQNVSLHINSILNEDELLKEATHKDFLLVRQEGNRSVKRQIEHYNLDMIIAIGYRVKSQVATRFRQWATDQKVILSKDDIEIFPFVKSMSSGVKVPADLDYKKNYSDYLDKKHK